MFEKSRLFAESWNVAFREKQPGTILKDCITPFCVVENSFRYWAADPFLFEENERIFIFAELYDYILCRGTIGYCVIQNGKISNWKQVIVEQYHLSFPNIFRDGEEIFIVAESSEANCLYRYRAIEFPNCWEKDVIIRQDVKYVDTVFISKNNQNFALTYDVKNPHAPKLYWLDVDAPENDHMLDLEIQELRRPAGKVIQSEAIRCAQDCTGDYGKGLVFYRYSFIKGRYVESEIKRLYPADIRLTKKMYLDGMHTYNFSENYEVIDIKTRRFNFLNFCFRFISKL